MLKIALLQINAGKTVSENFEIAKINIENAAQNATDVVILPELWNVGYDSPDEYSLGKDEWEKSAFFIGDTEFSKYQEIAKHFEVAVLLPFLEKDNKGNFYNSASLIDYKGNIILNYQKVHTVDKAWEILFKSGENFPVAELKTKNGPVKIGCMICYDREFPETARILMLNGAEIILVPNACVLENNRIAQFQSRGFENMLGVAMTNYPKPKLNGKSCAFDGMRVKGEDYDPLLVVADDEEGVWYASFDIDKLRKYREKEIWGDAYRKPRLYKKLTEDNVLQPFVRKDARR
ncbi:MAG: carbon-nitrogen hydrolase family protein [bacterium]|nr:carbon-nitrogen hydrolase family protein [bacterium]